VRLELAMIRPSPLFWGRIQGLGAANEGGATKTRTSDS